MSGYRRKCEEHCVGAYRVPGDAAEAKDGQSPRYRAAPQAQRWYPVPLTELEEAKRTTDEMIRVGRRMGLIGPKAKRRRAG